MREQAGWSLAELGRAIGRDKATVWRYEQGQIEVSPTVLRKIAELFDLSPRIFFEDEGEEQGNVERIVPIVKEIPLYSVPVSAGPGMFPNKVEVVRTILIPRVDATFAVQVKGDSMEPIVKDGTILLVDGNNIQPRDGEMIVCTYDSWVYVKWYHEENGRIYLISENAQYLPILVNPDEYFEIHGVVVSSYNTEGFRKRFK